MLYTEINKPTDFQDGIILLLNKPKTWSSFDIVRKVKSLLRIKLGIKKIKVGHGGTLDPLASGLMIVGTGKATKLLNNFQNQDKEYIADIYLGATTPSFDLETEPDKEFATEHITEELVKETLNGFIGKYEQRPPLFSAKRVNGKRAYKLARQGSDMKLEPVIVNFFDIELLSFNLPDIQIRVKCSKGTYIRSLADDIGKELNSGAYLAGLKRTASGDFKLNDAIELDVFQQNLDRLINNNND